MDNILSTYEEKMTKSYNNLESEFTTIRAGRANPHILDKLKVDYYFSSRAKTYSDSAMGAISCKGDRKSNQYV